MEGQSEGTRISTRDIVIRKTKGAFAAVRRSLQRVRSNRAELGAHHDQQNPELDNLTQFDKIAIQGNKEFVDHTQKALKLLKSTSTYAVIAPYLGIIKEGAISGMRAYDEIPTYEVGQETWKHSDVWYASTIAHDGYHSLLFHEAKKRGETSSDTDPWHTDVWTGNAAEKQCLEIQRKTLEELVAEKNLIDYVKNLETNPQYHGNNKSWEDYQKRNW